jgi:hypothetical protein
MPLISVTNIAIVHASNEVSSSIDHLQIADVILKLYTCNILLFELFPLQRTTGSLSMQEQQKGLTI